LWFPYVTRAEIKREPVGNLLISERFRRKREK